MSPLSRLLLFVLALTATALPLPAGTIPIVSRIYAITVKGDCYSVTPKTGGGQTVKYLRSFQQNGRIQVTPRVNAVAGVSNGSNFRDAAFVVDHGTVGGGGAGALQYVTNESLFNFIEPGTYPAFDYSYVVANAARTALTITHDKTLPSTDNSFKLDGTLLSLPYVVRSGVITITFLANGRVSGKIQLNGASLLGSGGGSIVATFSGKATTAAVGN